jgi:hypothetical protein
MMIEKGKPFDFLIKMARGLPIRTGPQAGPGPVALYYPSISDRKWAVSEINRITMPRLQATQLTGDDGGALKVHHQDTADVSDRALARAILGILHTANIADKPADADNDEDIERAISGALAELDKDWQNRVKAIAHGWRGNSDASAAAGHLPAAAARPGEPEERRRLARETGIGEASDVS